ncbi:MAG: deoxyribonuclease IV [Bacillota bacterium]
MLKIGSHVSMSGKDMLLGSVEEALSYDASTFMVYTGAPQNTKRKPIDAMRIEEAIERMNAEGIHPGDVVIHAPYIMNLANPDPEKQAFAVDFLSEEVKRSHALGAKDIVLHPGSHVKTGSEAGIERIIDGLNKVFEYTKDYPVRIALETMSGKGTEIARSFEELAAIIEGVDHDERLSVCFDTCHVHDAGYDIVHDFEGVMEQFDTVVGLDRIKVVHVNDSKNERGANKDRHANIGTGHIGFEVLNKIVHHPVFEDLPKILETPYVTKDDDSKKRLYPPYKEEIKMFRTETFDPSFIERIRKENA